ncbi:MAG: hypothetical protein ACYTEQ_04815 [Planctomycetota bacterium]|jgi:hypothetical protein
MSNYTNYRKLFLSTIVVVFYLAAGHPAGANWWEQHKMTASDAGAGDRFGMCVSISGAYAIAGAPRDSDNGSDSGSAYVFNREDPNWSEQAKLTASDANAEDKFGLSASISGDYAVVGAPFNDSNGDDCGSAYVFQRTGENWTEQAKLTASDGGAGDYFGYSVSIDGNYVVVGAYGDEPNGETSGSAYVFRRDGTTWTEEAKLTASDGAASDEFGHSVSINGEWAILGARGDDFRIGAAYIFKREGTNWTEHVKLTAPGSANNDYFGHSVSISANYAIVGAYQNAGAGYAFTFKRVGTDWLRQQKLTAADGAYNDRFGWSVSVNNNFAAVGAYHSNNSRGGVYVFERTDAGWMELQEVVSSDIYAFDEFGCSVCVGADCMVVGAYRDDDDGDESGSAYVFGYDETRWGEDEKLAASDGGPGEWFGYRVSKDGDYFIVGARDSAYVFVRAGTGWSEQTKVTVPANIEAVSISGDYTIVGTPYDDDSYGSAYVFHRDGSDWTQQQKLTASDGARADLFGQAVSISGDYAVVGSLYGNGYDGCAYVFKRDGTTWTEEAKLTVTDGNDFDEFGGCVSLSGEYAIVGARNHDFNGKVNSGCAYIFKRSGSSWTQQVKLVQPYIMGGDEFGNAVCISGQYAIVGATRLWGRGGAYIYKREDADWVQDRELFDLDGTTGGKFGYSVSISDDYAVVGVEIDAAVCILRRIGATWTEQIKVRASGGGEGFGRSVSTSNGEVLAGAHGEAGEFGANTGSAYVFKKVCPSLFGDLNSDCCVDFNDFALFVAEWLSGPCCN